MKILEITKSGIGNYQKLTQLDMAETRAMYAEEGILLPTDEQLEFELDSDWAILENQIEVHVKAKNKDGIYWLHFKFVRGFVWDLASVPKFFRGIVDNDDPSIIVASAVHDSCFTGHLVSFHDSNDLLRAIARYYGASRLKAFIYWAAVSTPVGRWMYNKKTIHRATWQMRFVDFRIDKLI